MTGTVRNETLPRQTHQGESQAGLIPRGSAHAHSVCHGFVAFLWQIPPIRPVLPVFPTYNCFAVNNLRVDRLLHTVEVKVGPRSGGSGKAFENDRRQGTKVRRFRYGDLLLHGQDREQNFTKFFTELCAVGTPNTPGRSSLLH
jgi:hypothetical protein